MSRFLRFCAFLSVLFFTTNVFAAGYSCPTYKKYTSCNAGYYMTVNGTYNGTPAVGNACTICPAGSYCTGGTANKVACARGSYTNATGKSACTACSAGTTTSGTGQTSCNATCSNNNSYDNSWATPSWSANTVTNLCKISNCKAGSKYSSTAYTYYTGTCTACGSGTYMASSAHTNTSCTSCTTTSGWTTTTSSTGSTAYTACYQTQTPTNCASGTIKRTASSISGTTITYGTASVTSALSSNPGYYVNGTSCTVCANGKFYGGGTATSCTSCPSLTSGYSYVSGTGWDAYGDCKETKAYSSVSSNCYSGALTKTATSATAWGTAVSTLTAKGGYKVSGSGDSTTCSACGYGSYSSNGNDTTCDACPTADSGWTAYSTSNVSTTYSACYEYKSGTNISSYCSAGQLRRAASSASAYSTTVTISTALQAKPGAYVNGQTCTQCSGAVFSAGGTATSCTACPAQTDGWTRATGTGWDSYTDCYQTKAATAVSSYCYSGQLKQIGASATTWATATVSTAFTADKGSYVTGSGANTTCTQCAAGTYQGTDGSTATSCTAADKGYYVDTTGASTQKQCTAGTYTSSTAQSGCSTITSGCWGAAGATSACPNNCNALPAPAVTGGTFSSATPRSANTSCRYVAPSKTATGCSSITANTVSYSGSAWGTNFYTTKASKGYRVSATGNTSAPACTACACGTYQGTDGSTATSCTTTTAGYYANGTGNSSQTQASAGYYAAAGACDQTVLNNGCWGSAGASTACPNNCNALPAPAVTGGTFSSATPRSANTSCRYVAPSKTATGCSSITANTVSYSGSAWGTNFYTTKASKGYRVSATGNTSAPACTACACGTYQGTDGSTATSCTTTTAGYYANGTGNSSQTKADAGYYAAAGACDQTKIQAGCFGGEGSASACPNSCPAAESGWTLASTTGLKVVTDCAEITTPSTSGSPIATICTAGTLTKKATNATTWGSATASGLTAKAGRYVNGTTCSACAAGTYTSSATTATSCTPAATGYYVSGTEATSQTACPAGTYQGSTGKTSCSDAVAGTYTTGCKDTTNNKACTGTSVCSNGTYSDQKASSCTACTTAKGYTNSGTTASSHAGAASCKVTCGAGQYVASAGAGCVNVGVDTTTNTGYWGAGGTVSQTATLARNKCDTGLITTGSGTGANEAADCGRKLHAGDNVIYLRSESRTTPALRVKVGDKTFFGALSTTLSGALKVKNGSTEYSVVNDYQ